MLEWYHIALIALAVFAGASSWNVPRAILWLSAGALSFVTSVWWHRYGMPGAILFGAVTNFVICVLLSRFAKTRWEMGVFNAFILMILIDGLYAAGFTHSLYVVSVAQELVNAAAILIIASPGAVQRVERYGLFHSRDSRAVHHCHRLVLAQRPRQ